MSTIVPQHEMTTTDLKTLKDASGALNMLHHLIALEHISEEIMPYADQQWWKDHIENLIASLDALAN